MAAHRTECYMTLIMSDSYLPGAMVLAHSLKDAGATRQLVALVTLDTLAYDTIQELRTLYHVIPVDRIPNSKPANLFLMGRPDLLYAFTKLALWRQTEYSKIVYIDADVVALRNLDELFNIDADFAAAPDIGWPDAFNSGLMILKPGMGTFWALQALAQAGDSFDGADQGLLNQYYEHRPWHRISFTYNCTPSAEYQWEPAYRYHKSNIKAVHFIGKDKPWFVGRQVGTGVGTYGELVGKWWSVYDRHYRQSPSYVPGKSFSRSTTVQQLVFGEHVDMYHGVPEHERLPPPASTDVAPTIQPRLEDQNAGASQAENERQRHDTGQPSQEQPKDWRAPPMPWDATRSAPPVHSQPEAANFQTGHYTFEGEKKEFQPPKAYPEPPKDMWYNVPETKPTDTPKAIFPWERQASRTTPTRKFAEDLPPLPQPQVASPREAEWAASSGGMEKYIRQIMQQAGNKPQQIEVMSPNARKESLIFTGMPLMQNRPSLPVTPAPERVNTFWGEEDGRVLSPEVAGEPILWNPEQKLEELRRSSLVEVVQLVKPEVSKTKAVNMDTIPESTKKAPKYKYTPKPPLMHSLSDDVSDLEIEEKHSPTKASAVILDLEAAAAARDQQARPSNPLSTTTNTNTSTPPRIPPKPVAFSSPSYGRSGPAPAAGNEKSAGSFTAESSAAAAEASMSPTER